MPHLKEIHPHQSAGPEDQELETLFFLPFPNYNFCPSVFFKRNSLLSGKLSLYQVMWLWRKNWCEWFHALNLHGREIPLFPTLNPYVLCTGEVICRLLETWIYKGLIFFVSLFLHYCNPPPFFFSPLSWSLLALLICMLTLTQHSTILQHPGYSQPHAPLLSNSESFLLLKYAWDFKK